MSEWRFIDAAHISKFHLYLHGEVIFITASQKDYFKYPRTPERDLLLIYSQIWSRLASDKPTGLRVISLRTELSAFTLLKTGSLINMHGALKTITLSVLSSWVATLLKITVILASMVLKERLTSVTQNVFYNEKNVSIFQTFFTLIKNILITFTWKVLSGTRNSVLWHRCENHLERFILSLYTKQLCVKYGLTQLLG